MKKTIIKRIIGATTLGLAVVGLAGCASSTATTDSGKAPTTEDKGMKIAILSSPSGVDDGSFNEENYNGILSFIKDNPEATVTDLVEETGAPDAAVQMAADVVADYDVIVATGFQFTGIGPLASENPEKQFILVDSYPTDAEGNEAEFENIYAMTFAEQESGFFAGVSAALETKTNKVAVVNGVAFPSNVNYQYGFEAGVNYANKHFDKKVEVVELPSYAGTDVTNENVGGNYVGNFNDEATGKVVGNALIDKGVDVMLVAAGGSGNGVFAAAKEAKGVKVIGCDVDQYEDGANGSDNIILTSALKVMGVNVDKQLENIKAGNFKGENALLTAETDSTGLVREGDHQQLSEDTIEKINKIYDAVKAGDIVPPSNFSDTTVDNFPGL